MRKNGKTNAVGRGGALLRPAGYTELSKIFGESVCTYPLGRRGRCPHRPGRMHRFYRNLRRICNFSMGRQSRRPLQQPFALSVVEDDSVRPRDVPILRESSANSQLPNGAMCASPPTSKEVTACGFAANSRRNSLHSAGRAEPRPYQLRLHFNGFCVKQTVYGLRVYLKTPNAPGQRAFLRCAASFFLEIRQYSCEKMSCATQKSLAAGHIMSFQIHPSKTL